ncbi:YciI family protein [Demequina lignilytica]|uniref:YciI family protein n=1 Tax=Demequina lignilytica TaxID=3051663 RepID=A0AAW7M7N7_9MICO|nr:MULTISPECIES: YciI family protein [unclassified Demequina]MDN4479005.1 YciI family protein [Demequina sp. SYSU T00039-1]MDN4484519.1 YciI family protein [Demequina sp. SYSU T0a273]MDN4489076.1 YciI family protein [Demequina sp. SYSU T00039]MDN4491214.1 YciI family protein [Demequina sp. SYSU T00068]
MSLYAVHYTYDERADDRAARRPEHLAHFRALAASGRCPAIGRYGDALQPGALIVLDVDSLDEAEQIVANDPYVLAGLVPERSIREWPAFGAWPARDFPA